MAGGIGSRFWPISSEDVPKQFIDILSVGRTFIQQTYDRFKAIIPIENFVVVTNSRYRQLVLEQLPELKPEQVLCEPLRRNTAPCVAYAAYHIKAKNPNATMVVTPSDHLILNQREFENIISTSMEIAASEGAMMTIGIKPTRAETAYGYIQTSSLDGGAISKVKTFTEKPNLELAKVFVESGEFFWNSGIFVWSIPTILKAFNEHLPDIVSIFEAQEELFGTPDEQEYIDSIYPSCKNISIDYGIMEHVSNVLMYVADFGWSDVGTWGSIYNIHAKDSKGNIISAPSSVIVENTTNSIIDISSNKQAIIEGLDNHIVVMNEDRLLIFNRDREQEIGKYSDSLKGGTKPN